MHQQCIPGFKHAGEWDVNASGSSAGSLLTHSQQFNWQQQYHKRYEQTHLTQHNLTSPRPPPLVFKLLEQQRREGGGEGKYRPLHGDSRRNLRSTYHRQSTIVFKNQFSNLLPGETL